jgi:hypothetical protein
VVSVYGTGDFVTITREEGAHAPTVEAEVVATLQRAL